MIEQAADRFNDGKMRLDLIPPTWAVHLAQATLEHSGPMHLMADTLTAIMTSSRSCLRARVLMAIQAVRHNLDMEEVSLDRTVQGVCDVLEFGETKYSAYNWSKGLHFQGIMASASRHWYAREILEEVKDEETGLDHRFHLLTNLLFLLFFIEQGRDDLNNLMGTVMEDAQQG